jgi:superfamily II DNA or RNA helicase
MSGSKSEVQAYESQAIGRAHRQGQKGEVTVVRLIIRNTIEHEMYLKAKEPDQGNNFFYYSTKNTTKIL